MDFPYKPRDLDAGWGLVRAFKDQDVSQRQLAIWLEQFNVDAHPKTSSVWLDGQWKTYAAPLREAGYTITALLEQDRAMIDQLKSSELPRYTLPLPARNFQGWPRHQKGYLIAPREQWGYCPELGAFELKQEVEL